MKKYFVFTALIFCVIFISAQQDSLKPKASDSPVEIENINKDPEFPGGHQAFVQKILSNFRTSVLSGLNITTARAVATFIIERDGSMREIRIESSENEMVKKEFLRALYMTQTRWIPGEINGEKIRARMRQPLVFSLK